MTYDAAFFDQITGASLSAAEVVIPWTLERIPAKTVIDIGCGSGAFLSVAKRFGCTVVGVDGFVPDGNLLIDESEFFRQDLDDPMSCAGFDLAVCLEVAEHLPESSAPLLVEQLCKADYVLWSAAIPGQGGLNHVNEQWSTWWEPLFADCGYVGSVDIRRALWDDRRIAGYYRQNLVIWTSPERLADLGMSRSVTDDVHPDRALGL